MGQVNIGQVNSGQVDMDHVNLGQANFGQVNSGHVDFNDEASLPNTRGGRWCATLEWRFQPNGLC